MSLRREIEEFRTKYGVKVDQNLYTSLYLSLLAGRHLVIDTEDILRTQNELTVVLDLYWSIGSKVVTIESNISTDMLRDLFNDFAVVIIIGIDSLNNEAQLELLNLIQKTQDKEIFSIIAVCNSHTALSRYLKDIFWFQQSHFIDKTYDIPRDLHEMPIQYNRTKIHQLVLERSKISSITVVPELKRYIYDIIIFVRTHRCVDTGISTKHLDELLLLGKALCVIFDRKFLIPSIIKLSAKKLIPLHIEIISPSNEPSLQWGGDPALAAELVRRSSGLMVVEDVLKKVSVPL